jgi:hypothetical protein
MLTAAKVVQRLYHTTYHVQAEPPLKPGALANYLLGEYSLGFDYMPARSESERLEYIDVDDGERN